LTIPLEDRSVRGVPLFRHIVFQAMQPACCKRILDTEHESNLKIT
jgi:hypothetical protein